MDGKAFVFLVGGALVLFCFPITLWAVDINRDSLIEELKNAPGNSEVRAELLLQLSESYAKDVPDEAILFGEELIRQATLLGSPELLYRGHMATGVAYAVKGTDPEAALRHFIDALDISKGEAGAEWELRQVKSRINIAGIHWQLENIGTALAYAYQNIAQLQAMDTPLTLADAYRTAALMHRTAENYDSTFYYLKLAQAIYKKQGAAYAEASTLNTLAKAYQQTGLHEQARHILYEAHHYAQAHRDSILLRDTYQGLATAYLRLNRPDSAEYYARALLNEALEKSLLSETAIGYELLSELFDKTNQPDSALFYYRQYAGAREKLISDEKTRAIQEMDTRYRVQEKARENRILREQYGLVKFRNTLLLISSLLFLILIAVIAFFYRRLQRRKAELERLNMDITHINSRLMALMNEKKHMVSLIAHDIRNPLSLIQLNTSALAETNALKEEEQQEILSEIEQATAEIDRACLRIMEVENQTEKPAPAQDLPFDLIQALKKSIREFNPFARSKSISLQFHANEPRVDVTGDPFLFRHIIANLLSNAVKFSPPDTKVEVILLSRDHEFSITVKDEGPGLSPQQQKALSSTGKALPEMPSPGRPSRGKGLVLTHRYVEAMGGKLSVESHPGEGASFTVRFPFSKPS